MTLVTLTTESGEEMTGALKRAYTGKSATIFRELRMLMALQGHRSIVEVLAYSGTDTDPTAMLTKCYPHCLRDATLYYKHSFLSNHPGSSIANSPQGSIRADSAASESTAIKSSGAGITATTSDGNGSTTTMESDGGTGA